MDCSWAPSHSTKPQGGFEGRKWVWHGLDCLSDGERTVWRTQGLFFTVHHCHFPEELGCLLLHQYNNLKIKQWICLLQYIFRGCWRPFAVNQISMFSLFSGLMLEELGNMRKYICVLSMYTDIFMFLSTWSIMYTLMNYSYILSWIKSHIYICYMVHRLWVHWTMKTCSIDRLRPHKIVPCIYILHASGAAMSVFWSTILVQTKISTTIWWIAIQLHLHSWSQETESYWLFL